MSKKTFWVDAILTVRLDFEVEANSEEEALEEARLEIIDDYHLDVHGMHHIPLTRENTSIDMEIDVGEYDED